MTIHDVRTYDGPPILGVYDFDTFLFDDQGEPQTHTLLGRNDVRIIAWNTDETTTTVGTTTTSPLTVGDGVGLSLGTPLEEHPAVVDDVGGISSITMLISPEGSSGTAGESCPNFVSSSGAQRPGYVIPGDSSAGLLWSLPGGVQAVWPEDIDEEENDENTDLSRRPDRLALFNNPFCGRVVWQAQLQIRDGKLLIAPPLEVLRNPAIYNMEVIWTQGGVTTQNQATISVEQSLYNRALYNDTHGPISLSRIRTRMRDWPASNDLLGHYEYSAAEICTAMLEAIEFYNETPPWSAAFTVSEFPYRLRLLDATIARMLMTSGQWMMRNQATIQAEGVSSDTRDKYFRVLQLSQAMWAEYKSFVVSDKASRSIEQGFISIF